jgi:hypothetical protein
VVTALDVQACRHEALHAVTALHYGWQLHAVVRLPGCGYTFSAPRQDAFKAAVVLLMPFTDGLPGCDRDMEKAIALGQPLEKVLTTCDGLLAFRTFTRKVSKVETALMSRTAMSGDEIEELLHAAV